VLAVMVATGVVVAAILVVSSATARPARSHQRPHLSERRILDIAKKAAARAGDPRPSLIQHSEGTRHNANLVGMDAGVPGRQWSYLIAERGRFVLKNAHTPPGAPPPRGSVLVLVVDASTGQSTDGGVSSHYPHLHRLGPVHTDLRRSHRHPRTAPPHTFTVPTTATFPSAHTGELIRCVNHGTSAGAHVPPPGQGVGAVADGSRFSAELELTRRTDGSLRVSCKP
jgi:hypothetical protein